MLQDVRYYQKKKKLVSNPGSGLGMLLAFSVFGKGMTKKSAPGAIIIHFFGGIHELYFPYVLMKPMMILSMIAEGKQVLNTTMSSSKAISTNNIKLIVFACDAGLGSSALGAIVDGKIQGGVFDGLSSILSKDKGIWSKEAEKYLLDYFNISVLI